MSKKCKYRERLKVHFEKFSGNEYVCNREAEDENYCIFHLDKPITNPRAVGSEEARVKQFQYSNRFEKELIQYMAETTTDEYQFVGFVFPNNNFNLPNFNKNVLFQDVKFPQGFSFGNKLIFEGHVAFYNTLFNSVHFSSGTVFKGSTSFRKSIFCDGFINGVTFEKPVHFEDNAFYGRYINFSPSYFKDDVFFSGVKFVAENEITIETSKSDNDGYKKIFHKRIPEVNFTGSQFDGQFNMSRSEFHVKANFNGAKFKGGTHFFGACK